MNYPEKLRTLLKQGQVVPVVGAGVSFATAGLPGWKGLVENGLEYARQLRADSGIISQCDVLLSQNKLTEAASLVKRLLNAPGHPFSNWLNDIFGRPNVRSTELISSIQNLCQPVIATTNYDDLLRSTGSPQTDLALDWTQHQEIQSYIEHRRQFILHLHGLFTRPSTPIFGADDYASLKKKSGYKTILNQLWLQRHFLFIGCSRDGVMDDDFMTVLSLMEDWFPSIQKEHYILLLDHEIGSETHWEMMRKCNVHAITIGANYDQIPTFLNSINPNAEELFKRFQQRETQVINSLATILEAQPHENKIPEIEKFIRKNLGEPNAWLDSDRLSTLVKALESYNESILSKRAQFDNQQLILKEMVGIADLQTQVDLWTSTQDNIPKLANAEYVNMGILAYDLLESFPEEMLNDIEFRHPHVLHPYYLNGYLRSFYHQALELRKSRDYSSFSNDRYFFENLYRIMSSLLAVLEFDGADVYADKSSANLTAILPDEFLVVVGPKRLSITEPLAPYAPLADLPWDESLEFRGASVISVRGKPNIIGFSSKYCFRWDPTVELISSNFFESSKDEIIHNVLVLRDGDNQLVEVFTSKRRLLIANFSDSKSFELESDYSQYIRIRSSSRIFCRRSVGLGVKGQCLFELSSFDEYHAKLSTTDLWGFVKGIPSVKTALDTYLEQEQLVSEEDDFKFPFIHDMTISPVAWITRQVLAIRIRFGFAGPDSTAIVFIDPTNGFQEPLATVFFPNKNCFSFDTAFVNNGVSLVAGFLDFNEVGNLIQYLGNIDKSKLTIALNQPGIIPQEIISRVKVRDMFTSVFARPDRAFVIEEGITLHDITFPQMDEIATDFKDGIVSVQYFNKTH